MRKVIIVIASLLLIGAIVLLVLRAMGMPFTSSGAIAPSPSVEEKVSGLKSLEATTTATTTAAVKEQQKILQSLQATSTKSTQSKPTTSPEENQKILQSLQAK